MKYHVNVVILHYTLNQKRDLKEGLRVFNRCWDCATRSETDPVNVISSINVFLKREILIFQALQKQEHLVNHTDKLSAAWKFAAALPRKNDSLVNLLLSIGELYCSTLKKLNRLDDAQTVLKTIYKHVNGKQKAALAMLELPIVSKGVSTMTFSLGAKVSKKFDPPAINAPKGESQKTQYLF